MFPCELSDYKEYCIGNIDNDDYIDMVNKAIKNKHEYFKYREFKECEGCPWWYFCRGGCKSSVKYSTGSTNELDKTECTFNRILYPKLVEILLNDAKFAQYLMNGEF